MTDEYPIVRKLEEVPVKIALEDGYRKIDLAKNLEERCQAAALLKECAEALEGLSDAARSSCNAVRFPALNEALAEADAILTKLRT